MQLYAFWQESNLRPCDSGAALLPTELQYRVNTRILDISLDRVAGSIPARGQIVVFFEAAPG